MAGDVNSHAKAVAAFAALTRAPGLSPVDGPAALSRAAGLPASSGHRVAARAETAGLLVRDTEGVYRAGPTAIRIGMSALGFGDLSYVAEPILVDTRRSVGLTACLAIRTSDRLVIGPWSAGRGRDFVRPAPQYHWSGELRPADPVTRTFLSAGEVTLRQRLRLAPLCERSARLACLAVLLPAYMARLPDPLDRTLIRAAARFPVAA